MAKRVETTRLQFEIEVNGKKVQNNIKDIAASYKILQRQVAKLERGSDEYNKKVAELGKLKAILDDHRKQVRGASSSFKEGTKGVGLFKKSIRGIGAALKTAFAPLLALSIVAEIVNIAKAAFEVSEEFARSREEINRFSGESGERLSELNVQAQAISKTFDRDVTEVIEAANATAKGFGEDFGTALTAIEKGLSAVGPNGGDEFLAQMREYSVQADDLGLTIDQTAAIIARSQIDGTYTDKGIDAIKEFNLSVNEIAGGVGKAREEVLRQAFGDTFANELISGIKSGEVSSLQALETISGGLGELDSQGKEITPTIAGIFGAPGEDAGKDFILSLQNSNTSLDDLIDTTNIYVQRQQEQLLLEKELARAQEELSIQLDGTGFSFSKVGTILKTALFNNLAQLVEWFRYLPERFEIATSSWQGLANTIIDGINGMLNVVSPLIFALEKITGQKFELPRFEVPENTLELEKKLQEKIAADRAQFYEAQERQAMAAQGKRDQALRTQHLRQVKKMSQEEIKLHEAAAKKIQELREAIQAGVNLSGQNFLQGLGDDPSTGAREAYNQALAELEEFVNQKTEFYSYDALRKIETGQDIFEAERGLNENLLGLREDYLSSLLELNDRYGIRDPETEQELINLRLQQAQEAAEEEIRIEDEKRLRISQIVTDLGNILLAIQEKRSRRALEALDNELEAVNDKEAEELKIAGNNEKLKTQIRAKAEKDRARIEKEQAKQQKTIALKRFILEAAIAVAKAIASAPPPINLGAILTQQALLLAPRAILEAVQFAGGGVLPGSGGIPSGPGHRDGGILLVERRSGRVRGEIEGGEPILSRRFYQNNRELVDRMLHESRMGGGRFIFQDGGRLPVAGEVLSAPSTTPSEEVIENTRPAASVLMQEKMLEELKLIRQKRYVALVDERAVETIDEVRSGMEADRSRRIME